MSQFRRCTLLICILTGRYRSIKMSLLIYDLQSEDWINTYYMLKGFLKAHRPPKVSTVMKCTNEKMTWNTQDTDLSTYVPKANVDHTISGQGTGISTLNHLATTPRANSTYLDQLSPCYYLKITITRDTLNSANSWLPYCLFTLVN